MAKKAGSVAERLEESFREIPDGFEEVGSNYVVMENPGDQLHGYYIGLEAGRAIEGAPQQAATFADIKTGAVRSMRANPNLLERLKEVKKGEECIVILDGIVKTKAGRDTKVYRVLRRKGKK